MQMAIMVGRETNIVQISFLSDA
uniref:Uncharacterized protein n=1 Tax=Rhizophora mucronata TaxID=61149 RepID=A0A2P2P367_RHIMU